MNQNVPEQKDNNQQKEINMVLNPDQIPINIEENTQELKEQLSNTQNPPKNPLTMKIIQKKKWLKIIIFRMVILIHKII